MYILYSGIFSWVQIFAESPRSPSEDIFAVLIFVPLINLSSSMRLTFLQFVIFTETNLSKICGNLHPAKISRYTVHVHVYVYAHMHKSIMWCNVRIIIFYIDYWLVDVRVLSWKICTSISYGRYMYMYIQCTCTCTYMYMYTKHLLLIRSVY